MDSVTEEINEMHLQPWSDLCKAGEVVNTPLTPFLDKELLKDNALSVDGSKVDFYYYTMVLMRMHIRLKKLLVSSTLSLK